MTAMMFYDISRCDNCGDCVAACKASHFGRSHIFVNRVGERYVPLTCRHCEHAACVEACPTGACSRSDDGVVRIASMKCVGCQLCAVACPYGAIWFDKLNKVSRKCDLCADRRTAGMGLACVEACGERGALVYGEPQTMLAAATQRQGKTLRTGAAGAFGALVQMPADWPAGGRNG